MTPTLAFVAFILLTVASSAHLPGCLPDEDATIISESIFQVPDPTTTGVPFTNLTLTYFTCPSRQAQVQHAQLDERQAPIDLCGFMDDGGIFSTCTFSCDQALGDEPTLGDCENIMTAVVDSVIRPMTVTIPALSGVAVSLLNNTCAVVFFNDDDNETYDTCLTAISDMSFFITEECPQPRDGFIGSVLSCCILKFLGQLVVTLSVYRTSHRAHIMRGLKEVGRYILEVEALVPLGRASASRLKSKLTPQGSSDPVPEKDTITMICRPLDAVNEIYRGSNGIDNVVEINGARAKSLDIGALGLTARSSLNLAGKSTTQLGYWPGMAQAVEEACSLHADMGQIVEVGDIHFTPVFVDAKRTIKMLQGRELAITELGEWGNIAVNLMVGFGLVHAMGARRRGGTLLKAKL
ncbi:hypothetical protein FB451DRAFT_1184962 [Mycena latifolia]|nr:hypothetical protein FB451DRAFT_1184962 [Mycena latifolia]